MKFLVVVTPPYIYHGCFTRKAFWEEKFAGKEDLFLSVNTIFFVIAMLGNTRRSGVVTSTSPWTSHQRLTVWTGWKQHLQSQKKNWKYQERGWLPLWVSIPKQGRKRKKSQGMPSEMSVRRTFIRLLGSLRNLRIYLMRRRGPNIILLRTTFI